MMQKLKERKDHLLSTMEQNHRNNLDKIQNGRDRVLADVRELSAACDRAEQELEQGGSEFLSQETILVLGKYRAQAEVAPTLVPVQTHAAVFGRAGFPEPLLGVVTVGQPFSSAPIQAAPTSPSGDVVARGRGHHHGNQRQGENQFQRVKFGGKGIESDEFHYPSGVVVSDDGEIFVTDSNDPRNCYYKPDFNYRIQVFTLQGTFVRQFPVEEMVCHGVAMDGEGNLWVAGFQFVAQYTKQGRVLRRIDLQPGNAPRGVAVDTRKNHIFVTHTVHGPHTTSEKPSWHREVHVFSPHGILVRTVTSQQLDIQIDHNTNRNVHVKFYMYITIDKEGKILVSDCDNHCIQVYNEDGQFLFKFGSEGSGEGQLKHPCGISTDRAGNIIVVDQGNRRVEMFDKTGRFLKHITTDMTQPCAVAMATQGQAVVADTSKCQINIFSNF